MKQFSFFIFLLFCSFTVSSQTYPTGLVFNDEAYSSIPLSATLSKNDYALPSAVSLRAWCPEVDNQGSYGTCVGWAIGYYARTILEAHQKQWSGSTITQEAFSPSWVYNQIRSRQGCHHGTYLIKALELIKTKGTAKLRDYSYCCECPISSSVKNKALSYKIQSYKRLFTQGSSRDTKIKTVKKALSEYKPVVIGFRMEESFFNAQDVWNPQHNPKDGGHAMCVVAYDDNKYGGAFLLINSWSKSWGNQGYTYVRYNDFADYCHYAFEMIEKRKNNDILLSGELNFKLYKGQIMKAKGKVNNQIITYEMQESYPSLTKFRFSMSNNKPAYVYALATDLNGEVHQIFPHKEGISPYLGYASNTIVLPSETSYIQMDRTAGTDFLCILYAKKELNIKHIIRKMENKKSENIHTRLAYILGNDFVKNDKIQYSDKEIKFNAKINNEKYILPLIVKIKHH